MSYKTMQRELTHVGYTKRGLTHIGYTPTRLNSRRLYSPT